MPEYEIPAAPPSAETGVNPTYAIYLPINKEIAESIKVDSFVEISFTGIVTEVSNDENPDRPDAYSMRVGINKIMVYDENEFEKMSRDDEKDDD